MNMYRAIQFLIYVHINIRNLVILGLLRRKTEDKLFGCNGNRLNLRFSCHYISRKNVFTALTTSPHHYILVIKNLNKVREK